MSRSRLGDALACYRFVRGLTVREVGAELGVSGSTISRLENGGGLPDGPTCARIFAWLLEPHTGAPLPLLRPTKRKRVSRGTPDAGGPEDAAQ